MGHWLAMVGIVTAIDAYYLLRRRGYREHLDESLAVLGPGLMSCRPPIPPNDLADPAFHLMHHAKRQLRVGKRMTPRGPA